MDHGYAARRAADIIRDDELEAAGIQQLFVTSADLVDVPAATRWIEAAVVRRAYELGVPAPILR